MARHRRELQQLNLDGSAEVVKRLDLSPSWGGKRPGAGRPKKYNPTATISVRVSAGVAAMVQRRAAECGQSVSAWLIDLIRFDLNLDPLYGNEED